MGLMGSGAWRNAPASSSPPGPSSIYYDDFVTGFTSTNLSIGALGWACSTAGGGYISDETSGVAPPGQAGRLGLIDMGTGTTNNSIGQAFLVLSAAQMYCGQAGFIMQWSFKTPAALSNSSVEYIMEAGIGVSPLTVPSQNACVITYSRLASSNWSAYTANNGTSTVVTSTDATDLAVVQATWYNCMMVMNAAGTSVSFYVAKMGGPYVLIGTSTTNLPNIGNQANPYFSIVKAGSSATTNRIMTVDWWQLNASGMSRT